MATRGMKTIIHPENVSIAAGASPVHLYEETKVHWGTLKQDPDRGSGYSQFFVTNSRGNRAKAVVKETVAAIKTAFSITDVS